MKETIQKGKEKGRERCEREKSERTSKSEGRVNKYLVDINDLLLKLDNNKYH